MKGLFVTAKNQLGILELPEPTPGPYEALIQVEACAICNSTDRKLIEGEFFSGSFPMLLGHESVGRVIALGNQVRSFQIGDRVLRTTLRDEHVPYPGGRSCWGGFVEKAIVTDVWAQKGQSYNAFPHPQQIVPPAIPPAEATLLITLKETLNCLENTQVQAGQALAIIGSGPVAQALAVFAKLKKIEPLIVFGRQAGWGEVFQRLGADAYVDENEQAVFGAAQLAAVRQRGGFERVIEAVGARPALRRALQIASPHGRVNIYGVAPESQPYAPADEADPRAFRGQVAEAEAHDQLLQWTAEGKIRLADWVSVVLPWTEYVRGFEMVERKRANKVVLSFV